MIRKSSLTAILSFFLGVLVINIIGNDYLKTYGIIPFWNRMVPGLAGISGERYFFYILLKRMKLFVMLLLLGKVFSKKAVSGLFASAVSFLLGVFLTMAVMDQGMRGFLLGAAAVPHWGCYLLAVQFYTATDQAVIYGYGKRHALNLALVKMGAFFLVGCFAEAYLLPGILWKIWGNR